MICDDCKYNVNDFCCAPGVLSFCCSAMGPLFHKCCFKKAEHTKANDILSAATKHLEDRGVTYDKPEGERSMAKVVQMFNTLADTSITVEQGWLFMVLLKVVRSQQGKFKADSYEDGASYIALAGEEAEKERK